MRFKRASVTNFGSFESLDFDYSNLGLALLSGVTGSGKSTIAEIPNWVVWGQTSKGGSVEDVRSWGAESETSGDIDVETPTGEITIHRVRGKATQNDLYYTEASDPDTKKRGKDMTETQKLIDERIGCDAELYNIGAFFGQFSEAGEFFIAKAKDRRVTLERISDLSMPVKLAEKASEARKAAKKELEALELEKAKNQGRYDQLVSQRQSSERAYELWAIQQKKTIVDAEAKSAEFEAVKASKISTLVAKSNMLVTSIKDDEAFTLQIDKIKEKLNKLESVKSNYAKLVSIVADYKSQVASAEKDRARQERLPDTCPECKRPGANPNRKEHLETCSRELEATKKLLKMAQATLSEVEAELKAERPLLADLAQVQSDRNNNERLLDQLENAQAAIAAEEAQVNAYPERIQELKDAKNPYIHQISETIGEIQRVDRAQDKIIENIENKTHRVASLTSVYDLSFVLRGELLMNSVARLQQETNARLEKYFDSAFRVKFSLQDSDKLEVEIFKDQYSTNFKALSGGQRKLLVISFSTALMKLAAEVAGVDFNLMIFDEVLAGLDAELKVKAFSLFEELSTSTESIIFIEHDDNLKSCFNSIYNVSIDTEGRSTVESGERSETS